MLEPIPYFYDNINRNAIVIKPKQPLFDWINSVFPDDPKIEDSIDEDLGQVYLIKEKEDSFKIENWLKRNFDDIFQNELNNWCIDEAFWPQKRTFKLFNEWFHYEVFSMVLDMEETPITKN